MEGSRIEYDKIAYDILEGIQSTCSRGSYRELQPSLNRWRHFYIEASEDLRALFEWMKQRHFFLLLMTASDEQQLEAGSYTLYYLFSPPSTGQTEGLNSPFIMIEHPLVEGETKFTSLSSIYHSLHSLEQRVTDLFSLEPLSSSTGAEDQLPRRKILRGVYPPQLAPLRKTHLSHADLRHAIEDSSPHQKNPEGDALPLPKGTSQVTVGPIHAGVIEAGQFLLQVGGEVIEDIQIRLGYKHRGISKLFETNHTLLSGVKLAERITGDTAFTYGLAYCYAVESSAGMDFAPDHPVSLWRGLFQELERIHRHIGNVAALVADLSFEAVAAEIQVLQEEMAQLCYDLAGHRDLRGINRPGGLDFLDNLVQAQHRANLYARPSRCFKEDYELAQVVGDQTKLEEILSRLEQNCQAITDTFLSLSQIVLRHPICRDRTIGIGVLPRQDALDLGATGLAVRASAFEPAQDRDHKGAADDQTDSFSALWEHDFRLRHPYGVYCQGVMQALLRGTVAKDNPKEKRHLAVSEASLRGDVFARLALRIAEVETSMLLVRELIRQLKNQGRKAADTSLLLPSEFKDRLYDTPAHSSGLGCVESWRGEIVCWIMKGYGDCIFRCEFRDPSVLNWDAMARAVKLKAQKNPDETSFLLLNMLVDFPLINKSFNLAYAGHDQ